jgi:hypothetical protein
MNKIFHRTTNKYNLPVKTETQSKQPELQQYLSLQKTELQARHTQSLQANNPEQQTRPTADKEEALKATPKNSNQYKPKTTISYEFSIGQQDPGFILEHLKLPCAINLARTSPLICARMDSSV